MTATSHNHNKPKGKHAARPRFHAYLPIQPVADAGEYAGLKKSLADQFDFFDPVAVDAPASSTDTPHPTLRRSPAPPPLMRGLPSRQSRMPSPPSMPPRSLSVRVVTTRPCSVSPAGCSSATATPPRRETCLTAKPPCVTRPCQKLRWKPSGTQPPGLPRRSLKNPDYITPEAYQALTRLRPDDFTDIGQATIMDINYLDHVRYSVATKYLT